METRLANLVLDGGGVKGIAIAGGIMVAESFGYKWHQIAGTSIGAMIGAMLCAGYTGEEIVRLFLDFPYKKLMDRNWVARLPFGSVINLWRHSGLFEGKYIEKWIHQKLAAKGAVTFGDLKKRRGTAEHQLHIVATDISTGRLLVLPEDISDYGVDPDSLPISRAVRMSISIPFFYKPVSLKRNTNSSHVSVIVDGGLISNFPVFILGRAQSKVPVFGFRLSPPREELYWFRRHNLLENIMDLYNTVLEARDLYDSEELVGKVEVIRIPCMDIHAFHFWIKKSQLQQLLDDGVAASTAYFSSLVNT